MIASELKSRGDSCPVSLPRRAIKTCATAEARSKKGRSYKPLPVEFTRDSFNYRQIARDSDAAIYEQKWNGRSDASACYEVIRIRRHDGFHIGGRLVEPGEIYPNSEAWGVDGWTVLSEEAAFRKLREVAALSSALTRFKRQGAER
jgi:hypothetical protein